MSEEKHSHDHGHEHHHDHDNPHDHSHESEDFEPEIVELDGERFEVIDGIEYEGKTYLALAPYVEDLDDEEDETEFIILCQEEEEDGFVLTTLDDDVLYDKIGEKFLEHFNELFADEDE